MWILHFNYWSISGLGFVWQKKINKILRSIYMVDDISNVDPSIRHAANLKILWICCIKKFIRDSSRPKFRWKKRTKETEGEREWMLLCTLCDMYVTEQEVASLWVSNAPFNNLLWMYNFDDLVVVVLRSFFDMNASIE